MQVMAVVNLMTFLVVALLLFLLVTPQGRRARKGESELHPSSDSHRREPSQSKKGELL
jgi:hypothetical protein